MNSPVSVLSAAVIAPTVLPVHSGRKKAPVLTPYYVQSYFEDADQEVQKS